VRSKAIGSLLAGSTVVWVGVWLSLGDANAQGQLVRTVFENYKLLGIFAQDCSKPAAANNFYYVHRMVDDSHMQRDRMSSTTIRDFAVLFDKAAGLGPDKISVSGARVDGNQKGQMVEEVWRVEPTRMMTWERTIGGKKDILDGRLNGQPLRWVNRCAAVEAPGQAALGLPAAARRATGPNAPNGWCHIDNYTFSTVLSRSTTTNEVIKGGAACVHTLSPIHPDQVQFTSAKIVKSPSNGAFGQIGAFAFRYQPRPGFKGADEYAIEVCGHNNERGGCATITYRATVN
jgi:hypothetical protein